MMGKIAFALLCFTAMGCSKAVVDYPGAVPTASALVRFDVVGGGWDVYTRSMEADGMELTDLWVYDLMGGEVVQSVHQEAGDDGFGSPSLSMGYGEHVVCFVASRGRGPSVEGDVVSWTGPSDTFWLELPLSVDDGSSRVVPVTLGRAACRLRVVVEDALPEGVACLEVTPATWWYGLDWRCGSAALPAANAARNIAVPSSYAGRIGASFSLFGMSGASEWRTGVSVALRGGDGSLLGSVDVAGVPFMRNKTTTLSGCLSAASAGFSVSLDDVWEEGFNMSW